MMNLRLLGHQSEYHYTFFFLIDKKTLLKTFINVTIL